MEMLVDRVRLGLPLETQGKHGLLTDLRLPGVPNF